ncbi:MAG: hypothetical protein IPG68_09035 [Micrococcales bacterium]|nr:hypothetical protein [Micrococcales bacterium]
MSTVAWQGTLLPVSAMAGPYEFSATRSAGFAPTAVGAALAAVHLSARIDAYTGPAVFTATIGDQVAGDTATLLQATTAAYTALAAEAGVTNGDPVPAPTGQVTGWHIAGFDPSSLTEVQLLVDTPDGASSVFTVAVQWVDGDCKTRPANHTGRRRVHRHRPRPEPHLHAVRHRGAGQPVNRPATSGAVLALLVALAPAAHADDTIGTPQPQPRSPPPSRRRRPHRSPQPRRSAARPRPYPSLPGPCSGRPAGWHRRRASPRCAQHPQPCRTPATSWASRPTGPRCTRT